MDLFFSSSIFILTILIVASIFDFKIREIPDSISFTLIGICIIIKLYEAINLKDHWIFTFAIIFGALAFIIGFLLTYFNVWGGADAKFLIAFGVYYGAGFTLEFKSMPILVYLSNFAISAFAFSLGYLIFKQIKDHQKIKELNKKIIFNIKNLATIIIMAIISFLQTPFEIKILLILISLLILLEINRKNLLAIEKKVMIKIVDSKELVEGDWLVHSLNIKIKKNGKTIEKIVDNEPMGLSKKTIHFLIENYNKKIKIKWGTPFIPTFLIAFILTNIIKLDLILILTKTIIS